MRISEYKTLVFDCDGVILDSNKVKTDAFYETALPYGESAAQSLVDYHIVNGGISRYRKLQHFLDEIVPSHVTPPALKLLVEDFASHVNDGLLRCEVAHDLNALRMTTSGARWLIVSGGDQQELREVFRQRDLDKLFDGGIFGSPDTKGEILVRELESGNISEPALFLGDSKYDYISAVNAGLDFLFLSAWTEVRDWELWCLEQQIASYPSLSDLLKLEVLDKRMFRRP